MLVGWFCGLLGLLVGLMAALFCWLAGCTVGSLVHYLVVRMVGWSICLLIGSCVCWLPGWLVGLLICYLHG